MVGVDRHELAARTSIELHRAVAERLRARPELVEVARRRVEGWRERGGVHREYAEQWGELLDRPLAELCAYLVDDSEQARDLRQVSPFAGVLDARTRWEIWRRARPSVRSIDDA